MKLKKDYYFRFNDLEKSQYASTVCTTKRNEVMTNDATTPVQSEQLKPFAVSIKKKTMLSHSVCMRENAVL